MASEPEDHPDVQVLDEIALIDHLVRASVIRNLPSGLSYAQFEVLSLLARRGDGVTPGEVARVLKVTKSGLTNTLQRLEGGKMVRTEASKDDGRRKLLWLTAEGRDIYRQAMAGIRPQIAGLRGGFSQQQFRDALPFLRSLRGWLAETP